MLLLRRLAGRRRLAIVSSPGRQLSGKRGREAQQVMAAAQRLPVAPVSRLSAYGQGLLREEDVAAMRAEFERSTETSQAVFAATGEVQKSCVLITHMAQTGQMEAAHTLATQTQAQLEQLMERTRDSRELRGGRISSAVSSLITGRALLNFLDTGRVLRLGECQPCTDEEYLQGIISLCDQISRYAQSRACEADRASVRICQRVISAIFSKLMEFDFRNSSLRRSFDSVKYKEKQVERLIYELSLLTPSSGEDCSEEDAGQREQKRLRPDASAADAAAAAAAPAASAEDANAEAAVPAEVESTSDSAAATDPDSVSHWLDEGEFDQLRDAYAEYDQKREMVIKECRPGQKASKNAVYCVHRGDLRKADKLLTEAREVIDSLIPTMEEEPRLRYGSFDNLLEEYVEARLFRQWIEDKTVLALPDLEVATTNAYLGGLADLTGEVGRFAVLRATRRDMESVRLALEVDLVVYQTLIDMDSAGMRKKCDEVSRNLLKVENLLYEQSLVQRGRISAPAADDRGEEQKSHNAGANESAR